MSTGHAAAEQHNSVIGRPGYCRVIAPRGTQYRRGDKGRTKRLAINYLIVVFRPLIVWSTPNASMRSISGHAVFQSG
jgi:hypothetical protein